jgi:hypothetical protein
MLLALSACTTPDKVALQEYAPTSSEADIEAVSLSASDNDTFDPGRVGTEFPDTTKQVAVWYRWDDADSGKKVGIRWSKNGEVVLEQGDTLAKLSGASSYVLKTAAGSKLPIGDYQVELLENGVAVTKIPFKVGTGSGEPPAEAAIEDAPAGGSGEAVEVESGDAGTEIAGDTTTAGGEIATGAETGTAVSESQPNMAEARTGDEPVAAEAAPGAAQQSQETKWPGVMAEVIEFRRKGNALTAKIRFSNRGTKRAEPDFYYSETYILDPANKKYEVIKDDEGRYLAALHSGYSNRWYDYVEPGSNQTVWMRFSAPPAAVKTASLQIPGMEPFEDLWIQN